MPRSATGPCSPWMPPPSSQVPPTSPPHFLPELPAADDPQRHRPVLDLDADKSGLRDRTAIEPPGATLSPRGLPARARAGCLSQRLHNRPELSALASMTASCTASWTSQPAPAGTPPAARSGLDDPALPALASMTPSCHASWAPLPVPVHRRPPAACLELPPLNCPWLVRSPSRSSGYKSLPLRVSSTWSCPRKQGWPDIKMLSKCYLSHRWLRAPRNRDCLFPRLMAKAQGA